MKRKSHPAIVIPAFNRAESLARLLTSITQCDYPRDTTLIISLEGNSTTEVREVAFKFNPPNLRVKILERQEQMGLRRHILSCGDLVNEFGSIILLEDDLIVDRYFYKYSSEALDYYYDDERVAGVALYSPQFNEICGIPFNPLDNGYSTYPMQLPCSWGQAWTERQWIRFREWYEGQSSSSLSGLLQIPESTRNWPESSWKKYFAAYLAISGRTFIYPYRSYSTNCAEAGGTHEHKGTNRYQVSMSAHQRPPPAFNFCPSRNAEVEYDTFMEQSGCFIKTATNIESTDIEVDINGSKPIELLQLKRYTISSRINTKSISTFSLRFRPAELNINFPLNTNNAASFSLCKTSDVVNKIQPSQRLEILSFYHNINPNSLSVIAACLANMPRAIMSNILNRWALPKRQRSK